VPDTINFIAVLPAWTDQAFSEREKVRMVSGVIITCHQKAESLIKRRPRVPAVARIYVRDFEVQ
ncbi:hypothetical protein, partial [Bradyrhizobium sp. 193]|uniref:hypothetical protein n=1 Tax=Bradyrhizobium sp. 193 TaxID=2782661 RepID=UPI001FF7C5C7